MKFTAFEVFKAGPRKWFLELFKGNDMRRYTERADGGYYFGYEGHAHCRSYRTKREAFQAGRIACGLCEDCGKSIFRCQCVVTP